MNSNSYSNCWCPLCPKIAQYDVQQLANHLSISHRMKNSASILARIMISSPMGYQEVVEVLKDVGNLKENMVFIEEWRCKVEELEHRNKKLEYKNQLLCKKVETLKANQYSQTDQEHAKEAFKKQVETIKDLEIEKLQQEIVQKKITVGMLKSQIIDTEAEMRIHQMEKHDKPKDVLEENDPELAGRRENESLDLILSPTTSLVTVVRDELETVKAFSMKKDESIPSFKTQVIELEVKLKSVRSKKKKLQNQLKSSKTSCDLLSLEVDKLMKEKESGKNISTQLIESQRIVHEKEIQDLNMKLQNQINRAQSLKTREKSLMEEVETLNAVTWKKNDLIESLTNEVNVLQVKIPEEAEHSKKNNSDLNIMEEKLEMKDLEIYRLHGKIATLDSKSKELEKEADQFKDLLFSQSKEILDCKHFLDSYKKLSQENVSEKDKIISCLEKDLESTKADAEIIVEEVERCSKEKISYQKTISNMKIKFGRYREIICLMKDSFSGLAVMHEETADKLIEAIRNTALASKAVVKDVKKQFKGFEKEMAKLQVPSDELVENNNLINVKKEPEDSLNNSFTLVTDMLNLNASASISDEDLGLGNSSKNAKLVAEDLSWEFYVQFAERDGGKKSLCQESVSGDKLGRENRSRSRLSKKRKFTE